MGTDEPLRNDRASRRFESVARVVIGRRGHLPVGKAREAKLKTRHPERHDGAARRGIRTRIDGAILIDTVGFACRRRTNNADRIISTRPPFRW